MIVYLNSCNNMVRRNLRCGAVVLPHHRNVGSLLAVYLQIK